MTTASLRRKDSSSPSARSESNRRRLERVLKEMLAKTARSGRGKPGRPATRWREVAC